MLALGGFAIGTTEFATMSLLPAFSSRMGVDAPTGGHVISAYALGVVVGAPLFAVLGGKVSRRNLLVILMGWFALGNMLSAFAPSCGALLGLRFLPACRTVPILASPRWSRPGWCRMRSARWRSGAC